MIRFKEYPQDELNRYYRRIQEFLEMSSFWRNLQFKAEAGSTRSEKGYQMIAKSTVESIARDLGYDVEKAVVLCMAVGSCYPRYGQEGLKLIEEYIVDKGLDTKLSNVLIETIEDYISNRLFVATDFDQLLKAYYLNEDNIPEVQLVRICQDMIKKVKLVERYSNVKGNLLFDTSQEMKLLSKQSKTIVESTKLNDLIDSLNLIEKNWMSIEEKESFLLEIDKFVHSHGIKGIYYHIVII